jgi:hypothetical protein
LGAYYTPDLLTDFLCRWTIREAADTILEPSFGGCGFLESSTRRLADLGCFNPKRQVFGCDIDPTAFDYLYQKLGLTQLKGHFLLADFLSVRTEDFHVKEFDCIVGNPPYIRHHLISRDHQKLARKIRDERLPQLTLQASLWAYFVVHACEFLKEGGRMAWILPSSFRHADYSETIQQFLSRRFESVSAILLEERVFKYAGSEEATIVVVADGHRQKRRGRPKTLAFASARNSSELGELLGARSPIVERANANRVFTRLAQKGTPLGDYCSLAIGTVTGDAKFFLFNSEKAQRWNIPDTDLRMIVSRAAQVTGLTITRKGLNSLYREGARTKLLVPTHPLKSSTAEYLMTLPKSAIDRNATFKKREFWFRPVSTNAPHAFFTGMSHFSPRIALNSARAPCTNSLYGVTFNASIAIAKQRLIAISMISSFSQVAAELCGRHYSGGMLKHEPSDAARILVLCPSRFAPASVDKMFRRVNRLLKQGYNERATDEVDSFLIANRLIKKSDRFALQKLLRRLRQQRSPKLGSLNIGP